MAWEAAQNGPLRQWAAPPRPKRHRPRGTNPSVSSICYVCLVFFFFLSHNPKQGLSVAKLEEALARYTFEIKRNPEYFANYLGQRKTSEYYVSLVLILASPPANRAIYADCVKTYWSNPFSFSALLRL